MHSSLRSNSESAHGAKQSLLDASNFSINAIRPSNHPPQSKKDDKDDDEDQFSPTMGWCAQFNALSYNIKLILMYNLFWGSSTSIWNFQLLATYIFTVTGHSTVTLGFIEAIQGGAYLVAAAIAGLVIDKYSSSRVPLLKFSGFLGLLVVVPLGCITIILVNKKYTDHSAPESLQILYRSSFYLWLFCYGICSSFCRTTINTVFTDLVPKGKRDFIFSFRQFVLTIARTLGPIIIVLMFVFLGNDWSIYEMNIVLLSGIGLWTIPLLMLIVGFDTEDLQRVTLQNDRKEQEEKEKAESKRNLMNGIKEIDDEIDDQNQIDSFHGLNEHHKYRWIVPWVMLLHRLVLATGAGMTVKFFPIFFEDVIGLAPVPLNSIWIITPLTQSIFTIFVERLANKTNRFVAMILFKSMGICQLLVMATITMQMTSYANVIIVSAYVIRTGAMNCAYPLERAVVMDHVEKKDRGKWNALESLNSTVWTLSAALGGYLISQLGYRDIYFITASVYTFSVVLLIPLMCITK